METFKLKLDRDWFCTGDILTTGSVKVEVLETPNCYYYKWYHRLLYYLTLGFFFKKTYSYTVKTSIV